MCPLVGRDKGGLTVTTAFDCNCCRECEVANYFTPVHTLEIDRVFSLLLQVAGETLPNSTERAVTITGRLG